MLTQRQISDGTGETALSSWRCMDLAPDNPLAVENQTLAALAEAGGPYEVGDSVWWNLAVAHTVKRSAGQQARAHLHPWLELSWVIDGTVEMWVEGGDGMMSLAPGDALLIPMHQPHACTNTGDCPVTLFGMMLEPGSSAAGRAELVRALGVATRRKRYVLRSSPMAQIVTDLRREISAQNPGWHGVCQGFLHGLMGRLWRELNDPKRVLSKTPPASKHADDDIARIHAVHAYIHAHLGEPLTTETIAAKNGISPRHLNRLCRAHGFASVKQTIQKIRMDQVRQLLQASDYSIRTIADLTGFSNADYLARVFRKEEGLTPTAYRRMISA